MKKDKMNSEKEFYVTFRIDGRFGTYVTAENLDAAKTAAMFSGIVAIAESVYKEDDISGCIGNVVKSSAGAAVSGGAAAISAEAAGVLAVMFGAGPVVMAAASLSVGFVAGTLVS